MITLILIFNILNFVYNKINILESTTNTNSNTIIKTCDYNTSICNKDDKYESLAYFFIHKEILSNYLFGIKPYIDYIKSDNTDIKYNECYIINFSKESKLNNNTKYEAELKLYYINFDSVDETFELSLINNNIVYTLKQNKDLKFYFKFKGKYSKDSLINNFNWNNIDYNILEAKATKFEFKMEYNFNTIASDRIFKLTLGLEILPDILKSFTKKSNNIKLLTELIKLIFDDNTKDNILSKNEFDNLIDCIQSELKKKQPYNNFFYSSVNINIKTNNYLETNVKKPMNYNYNNKNNINKSKLSQELISNLNNIYLNSQNNNKELSNNSHTYSLQAVKNLEIVNNNNFGIIYTEGKILDYPLEYINNKISYEFIKDKGNMQMFIDIDSINQIIYFCKEIDNNIITSESFTTQFKTSLDIEEVGKFIPSIYLKYMRNQKIVVKYNYTLTNAFVQKYNSNDNINNNSTFTNLLVNNVFSISLYLANTEDLIITLYFHLVQNLEPYVIENSSNNLSYDSYLLNFKLKNTKFNYLSTSLYKDGEILQEEIKEIFLKYILKYYIELYNKGTLIVLEKGLEIRFKVNYLEVIKNTNKDKSESEGLLLINNDYNV